MVIRPNGTRREDVSLGDTEYMAKVIDMREHPAYGCVSVISCADSEEQETDWKMGRYSVCGGSIVAQTSMPCR